MKTGIELIAQERAEQIEKHERTVERDVINNSTFEYPLTKAAGALTVEHGAALAAAYMKPHGWNQRIWDKMLAKSYVERLAIAGALIAAEIDRVQAIQTK